MSGGMLRRSADGANGAGGANGTDGTETTQTFQAAVPPTQLGTNESKTGPRTTRIHAKRSKLHQRTHSLERTCQRQNRKPAHRIPNVPSWAHRPADWNERYGNHTPVTRRSQVRRDPWTKRSNLQVPPAQLGTIMSETGLKTAPFRTKRSKLHQRTRRLERTCHATPAKQARDHRRLT